MLEETGVLGRFTLNGRPFTIPLPNDMTFGEIELIEDGLDAPLDRCVAMLAEGRVKALRLFTFVAVKRERPDVTMAELAEFKLSAIEAADEVDPTPPELEAAEPAG